MSCCLFQIPWGILWTNWKAVFCVFFFFSIVDTSFFSRGILNEAGIGCRGVSALRVSFVGQMREDQPDCLPRMFW